jgi:Ca-activated chloride channel family protein
MSFIWPAMLFSLLATPLFVLFYLRLQQRRRWLRAAYGTLGIVQAVTGRPLAGRRHLPPLLFLLGLTLLGIALGRPQAVVSLPRLEGKVILAFDVSGSMAADDLKPTRMGAARSAAIEFVQRQPSTVQVGVVAFSDSGFTVQPPTNDQAAILTTINRLRPERGTSLSSGILAALNTIFMEEEETRFYTNLTPTPTPAPALTPVPEGSYTSAAIVLLTDGENTAPPEPFDAAQTAADRGVHIYTIGVGSAAGATLNVGGFMVHTQLDEATLQEIARITDGAYYTAENEEELRNIYENINPRLVVEADKMEVTSLFAAASLVLLLIGGALSMLWFSRVP